jgi:hypothetical protein
MRISGYRNLTGKHCGSTAMRNLLYFYCGLDLAEEVVFGLGAGLDFLYFARENSDPAVLTFGRSTTMEQDLAAVLGVDHREQRELNDDEAWEQVRREVIAGRPTMLSGDAFYLTYRDFRVHFPGHRFVLLGFDDGEGEAIVADRLDPEPQRCSYAALRLSRNPPSPISTQNLWGKFFDTSALHSLEKAYALALAKNTWRMLEKGRSEEGDVRPEAGEGTLEIATGLSGIATFLRSLPNWRDRDDAGSLASYASNCIEKFGTGGGNFRAMYAEFLARAREVVPDLVGEDAPKLAARSSALWTQLSQHLAELAQGRVQPASTHAVEALSQIIELETQLFESLAARQR